MDILPKTKDDLDKSDKELEERMNILIAESQKNAALLSALENTGNVDVAPNTTDASKQKPPTGEKKKKRTRTAENVKVDTNTTPEGTEPEKSENAPATPAKQTPEDIKAELENQLSKNPPLEPEKGKVGIDTSSTQQADSGTHQENTHNSEKLRQFVLLSSIVSEEKTKVVEKINGTGWTKFKRLKILKNLLTQLEFIEQKVNSSTKKGIPWIGIGIMSSLPEDIDKKGLSEINGSIDTYEQFLDKESEPEKELTNKETGENKEAATNSKTNPEESAPTQPVTPEQTEDMFALCTKYDQIMKDRLENGPLSARMKKGVMDGVGAWENFGQGEAGTKGFAKRMTKTTVNLALVGAISLVSVEQLVKVGAFTASSLGAGTFASKMATRMAIGLGLGGTMDVGGKKIPDKIKKWLPVAMGMTFATLFSGGVVGIGLAAGATAYMGIEISKRIKGQFTNEKIADKKEAAKETLLQKYKNAEGTIDSNKIAEFEKDYKNLIKKYENQGIWGKGLDEGIKLLTASAISTASIGAAGYARDTFVHHQAATAIDNKHTDNQNKVDHTKHDTDQPKANHPDDNKTNSETKDQAEVKHDAETKTTTDTKHDAEAKNPIDERYQAGLKAQHDAEIKHDTDVKAAEIKHQAEVKHEAEQIKVATVHKGGSYERSFIHQIEHEDGLAEKLGYKGDLNDTKALHEFAGDQAGKIAVHVGIVDNNGHQLGIAEADKMAPIIKVEGGHVTVEDHTLDGKVIATHHEGDKFGEHLGKHEYVIKPHEVKVEELKADELPTRVEKMEEMPVFTSDHVQVVEHPAASLPFGEHAMSASADENPTSVHPTSGHTDTQPAQEDTTQQHPTNENHNAQDKNDIHTNSAVKSSTEHSGTNAKYQDPIYGDDAKHSNHTAEDGKTKEDAIYATDDKTPVHPTLEYLSHHAKSIYEHNTDKIFPDDKSQRMWEAIRRDFSAEKLMHIKPEETTNGVRPLLTELHKLQEITGLKPRPESLLVPAETPEEYRIHAYHVVQQMGKLHEVKDIKL